MIGQTISHYRVTAKLGEGGMGAVYRATDETLQREVALKLLPPQLAADSDARKRLVKEARAASRLNHPNIGVVYEVNDTEPTPFIAMELVKGESLKQRLERGSLQPAQLLDLARQIAEGLHEAHQAGVLHRDIKPANVMVDPNGRVKILDFGIAVVTSPQRREGEAPESYMSRTATQLSTGGTAPYMSPEQLRGEQPDARSDIFSFGVMLYECLAGRLPFRGETPVDVFHAILHQPPAPLRQQLPELSPDWVQFVERALEKSPAQRFQSMAELRQAVQRLSAPAQAEKSLAVLYFENLGGSKEDEYFRDGITEDVITELYKIKTLRVFPRPAVFAFRDKPVTAPEVGRQLNAEYVLGGSLRRAGNRLRISVQLVETRSGHTVWAERYDRELKDVFEVQDEIARSISQALRIAMSPQEERAIAGKPTQNAQAYDYFLRGRSYGRRCTKTDLEFAQRMYERAIALDPQFALAYAGLGYVCAVYYDWHEKDDRWVQKSHQAADRALALHPGLPEALAARAALCEFQGKHEEAAEFARQAVEKKPDCEGAYWILGQALFTSDQLEEAAALAPRADECAGADYNTHVPYMLTFERLGRMDEARQAREKYNRALTQHLELVPDDVRARILLACNHAFLGHEEEAVGAVEMAVALRPDDANILYNAACAYGIMSKKKEALDLLKRAKAAGFLSLDWVPRDPDLVCLHGDPEYERLIAETNPQS